MRMILMIRPGQRLQDGKQARAGDKQQDEKCAEQDQSTQSTLSSVSPTDIQSLPPVVDTSPTSDELLSPTFLPPLDNAGEDCGETIVDDSLFVIPGLDSARIGESGLEQAPVCEEEKSRVMKVPGPSPATSRDVRRRGRSHPQGLDLISVGDVLNSIRSGRVNTTDIVVEVHLATEDDCNCKHNHEQHSARCTRATIDPTDDCASPRRVQRPRGSGASAHRLRGGYRRCRWLRSHGAPSCGPQRPSTRRGAVVAEWGGYRGGGFRRIYAAAHGGRYWTWRGHQAAA